MNIQNLFITFAGKFYYRDIKNMSWKVKYRCEACGYEAEAYEGRGLFRQKITAMSCPECKTIQNIVVGGMIGDIAPSYRSEAGRLCLNCGSNIGNGSTYWVHLAIHQFIFVM